jgi:hypothetical protein
VNFGMPLHADHERLRGVLDRFDQAVFGSADGDQIFAESLDALMVVAVDHSRGPCIRASKCGCLLEFDSRLAVNSGTWGVSLVVDNIGEMLVQGSPASDVEDLKTAADGKERQIALRRGDDEGALEVIATTIGALGRGPWYGAVRSGIDVLTSDQDDPVELFDEVVGIRAREQQHWSPTRIHDPIRVGLWNERCRGVDPRPPRGTSR